MGTRNVGGSTGGDGNSSVRISVTLQGGSLGTVAPVLDNLANAHAQYAIVTVDLANGDNTITIPATARGVILIPPAGNAIAWKAIKSGDSGIPSNLIGMEYKSFAATPPASFVINATGALAGFQYIFT